MFKKIILISSFLLITQASLGAAFLKIGDIKGESQNSEHRDEIDILSWSWGASSDAKSACLQDIIFIKESDSATPVLLMNQIDNVVYPSAVFSINRSSLIRTRDYIILEFKNVRVNSHSINGAGADERPTEQISLSFDEVTYTYIPQSNEGANDAPITATIRSKGKCK